MNRMKAYRMKKEIKQTEMADLLGISITAYRNKESGKTDFTITEAKKIADFFEESIDDIFFKEITI